MVRARRARSPRLVALLELSASRLAARVARDRAPVLLANQDRTRWYRVLVRRGFAALARADELVATRVAAAGPYQLQAAIAAHHARAATAEARAEFQRAAELTRNERERDVLLARARDSAVSASCGS